MRHRFVKGIALICVSVLLSACKVSPVSSIDGALNTCQLDSAMADKLLVQTVTDLERVNASWLLELVTPKRFPGTKSVTAVYRYSEMPNMIGSITADFFDTEESAKAYYQKRASSTPKVPIYPQLTFNSVSNEHMTVCYEKDTRMNFLFTPCRSFIRYGCAVVSLYQDTFKDKWVSLQDYEQILQRIDNRFVAGLTTEESKK